MKTSIDKLMYLFQLQRLESEFNRLANSAHNTDTSESEGHADNAAAQKIIESYKECRRKHSSDFKKED